MFEAYPDGEDQRIGDDEWIARASEENWIALTKDDAIRRDHPDALAASRLRVFALNNANLTGEEMAERYLRHLNRIMQRATSPGPYVYVVSAGGLELRWRPDRNR
jgi:PIN like domain